MTVAENIILGLRDVGLILEHQRDRTGDHPHRRTIRSARQPTPQGLAALRRRTTARRDHQAALPRRRHPHPGRTDRRPHAAGNRSPLRHAARDDGRRQDHHLHQPQAGRSALHRRPHHRPARRQMDRHRRHRRHDQARMRQPHGRARSPFHAGETARRAGRRTPRRHDLEALNDKGLLALQQALALRSAPAKSSASPASPATDRKNLPRPFAVCARPKAAQSKSPRTTVTGGPPILVIEAGVAYVPEDRSATGSAPHLSVAENLALKSYRKPGIGRGIFISRSEMRRPSRAPDRASTTFPRRARIRRRALLSGGNLQKVILAREISQQPASHHRRFPHTRPGRRRHGKCAQHPAGRTQPRRRHPPHLRRPGRSHGALRPHRRAL